MEIKKRVEKLINKSLRDDGDSRRRSFHIFFVIVSALIITPVAALAIVASYPKTKLKPSSLSASKPVGSVSSSVTTNSNSSSSSSDNGSQVSGSESVTGTGLGSPSTDTQTINVESSSNSVGSGQTSSSSISVNGQSVPVPKDGVVNKTISSNGSLTNVEVSGVSTKPGAADNNNSSSVNVNFSDNSSSN